MKFNDAFENDPRLTAQYQGLAQKLASPPRPSASKTLDWLPSVSPNINAGISRPPITDLAPQTGTGLVGEGHGNSGDGHSTPGNATNGMSIGQAIGNAIGFTTPLGAILGVTTALMDPNSQNLGLKGIAQALGILGHSNAPDGFAETGFGPTPGAGNPGPDGSPGGPDGSNGPTGSSPGSTSGGAIGAESGGTGTGNDSGGSAPGGEMRRGGLVRGAGDGDDDANMRWLSNGEFVMPAEQTAKLLPALEYMRRTGKLPGPDALK